MKFQQFLEMKNRLTESSSTYTELLKEKNSSVSNKDIDNLLIITEDEMTNILADLEKKYALDENKIFEAEGFDLKTFLIQTANYLKASTQIESAVEKWYDAQIETVKKTNAFEDKWPETEKTFVDKIKNNFKNKITAQTDPKKKSAIRQERDAQLDGLADKLKDIKDAKLNTFKQASLNKENALKTRVDKLKAPEGGLPPFASTIITNMATDAENQAKEKLATVKYEGNEEAQKKALARIQKKAAEDAKEAQQDVAEAVDKMAAAQEKAGADIRNQAPTDSAISPEDSSKFDDGKEKIAAANEAMAELKTQFEKVKAAVATFITKQEEFNNAADADKNAKEDAATEAKAAYDAEKSEYNTIKSSSEATVEDAKKWCEKNKNATQSDIKSLASGSEASMKAFSEAIGALELPETAK